MADQLTPEQISALKDQLNQLNAEYAKLTGGKKFFENMPDDIKLINNLVGILTNEIHDLKNAFGSISDTLKNTLTDFNTAGKLISSINSSYNKLSSLTAKVQEHTSGNNILSVKELKNIQYKAKLEVDNLRIQKENIGNKLQEEGISEKQRGILNAQQTELNDAFATQESYLNSINGLIEKEIENEKALKNTLAGVTSSFLTGLKKIPILGDLLDIDDAQKAMRKAAKDGKSQFEQLGTGFSSLGESLQAAMGPLALITIAVKAIKALVDVMFKADEQVTSIAKNLSISKNEARGVRDYFITISNTIDTTYNRLQDVIDAQNQLSESSKFTVEYSAEALENQILLSKQIGLSEDEATKLNKSFILNNVEGTRGTDIVYDRIAAFANENKVLANGKKILQEVSKVSGQILLNFRGNLPALTAAVLQADRLGINLEEARNISNSLLDFESSISNELEASVFLGRRFNLDQARSLALRKDYVGATKEVLKQVGSIEEFESMSAIHQQVIAKAAGMTVDSLSESLLTQKYIGTTTGDWIKRAKDAKRDDIALAIANGTLQGEALKKAQASVSAQETFNIALDKAKEIFSNLVNGGTLDTLVDALKNIANYVAAITGTPIKAAETDILTKKATELQLNISKTPTGVEKEVKIKEFNNLKQTLTETSKGISDIEEGMNILGDAAEWAFTNLITLGHGTSNIIDKSNKRLEDANKAAIQSKKTLDELNNTINPYTPSKDESPTANAISALSNAVNNLINRQQPTPQFALHVDGRAIGTAVGKQMETGTAQNQYTGYKIA